MSRASPPNASWSPDFVRLARQLAERCNITEGFDDSSAETFTEILNIQPPEDIYALGAELNLNDSQINNIIENIKTKTSQQSNLHHLNHETSHRKLNESLRRTLSKISQHQDTLSKHNKQLVTKAGNFDFLSALLENTSDASEPLDLAAQLTVRWKQHFQTGPVCVYLLNSDRNDFLQAAICSTGSKIDYQLLKPPTDTDIKSLNFHQTLDTYNVQQIAPWIFQQITAEFVPAQSKLIPLIAEDTSLGAIIFLGFPWISTIGVLIYLAGLQNIDESVYDAASIDGANAIQRFIHIEFPLIIRQVKINLVLGIVHTIQDFGLVLILTGNPDAETAGGPLNSTILPGLHMYKEAFLNDRLGYASAIGVLIFIIILTLILINNKYVKPQD